MCYGKESTRDFPEFSCQRWLWIKQKRPRRLCQNEELTASQSSHSMTRVQFTIILILVWKKMYQCSKILVFFSTLEKWPPKPLMIMSWWYRLAHGEESSWKMQSFKLWWIILKLYPSSKVVLTYSTHKKLLWSMKVVPSWTLLNCRVSHIPEFSHFI